MSGRVAVVRGIPGDPRTLWVGAASGGLWKSEDAGLTFEAKFDEQPVLSIGSLAIAASSTDDIWVGTGEANPRNSLSLGNGVYRSLNGGRTWKHLGLQASEHIARIVLDPNKPDVAIVAATGPTWSDGAMRGVFRTLDGGASWDPVLQVDERTGCADLVVDPTNPRKMFAAMWDHQRQPWSFDSGGKGSGLYRTLDGGTTWTKLGVNDGMPKGELGRIGLAIAPSNPAIVYALVEAKKSVLLRSDDGGQSFKTSTANPGSTRGRSTTATCASILWIPTASTSWRR